MVFWRKKKNIEAQEQNERDENIMHPEGEANIELAPEAEGSIANDAIQEELSENEIEILEELEENPVPEHNYVDDSREDEELSDHSAEGGWLSRLRDGLGKSSSKITKGLGDILTKSKLDQDTLDELEDCLIEADLGPKTAARIIEEFSKDRFGKDIDGLEIKEALADVISNMLSPVAQPLKIERPVDGPYVLLVCGVNGAGKTTTIGKFTQDLQKNQGKSVMIVAGDTFRAAAVEQLGEWAKRAGATMFSKDLGADAASVAYEAYEKAKSDNIDVLIIDTAGRLQNKSNLMAELEKIVRVLKKKEEALPHSTVLVLDSTTGQNAYSQLEVFKESVGITGLIVTKLDGSAKGGVVVGLADQFGVPIHAIGIGEGIDDLRPFAARDYARSLMGLAS